MKKIISLLLALVLTLSACSVALAADVVLRPGDKGDAVKEVQTLLTSYGYYSGKINGSKPLRSKSIKPFEGIGERIILFSSSAIRSREIISIRSLFRQSDSKVSSSM